MPESILILKYPRSENELSHIPSNVPPGFAKPQIADSEAFLDRGAQLMFDAMIRDGLIPKEGIELAAKLYSKR